MKLKLRIAFVISFCFGMIVVFAFYFSYVETPVQNHSKPQALKQEFIKTTRPSLLNKDGHTRYNNKNFTIPSVASVAGIRINNKLQTLNFSSNGGKKEYLHILKYVKENLQSDFKMKVSPWNLAAGWVKSQEIHSENTPELGYVLNAMVSNKIIHAGVGYKGTQLKMMLKLEGGQEVIFKPQK